MIIPSRRNTVFLRNTDWPKRRNNENVPFFIGSHFDKKNIVFKVHRWNSALKILAWFVRTQRTSSSTNRCISIGNFTLIRSCWTVLLIMKNVGSFTNTFMRVFTPIIYQPLFQLWLWQSVLRRLHIVIEPVPVPRFSILAADPDPAQIKSFYLVQSNLLEAKQKMCIVRDEISYRMVILYGPFSSRVLSPAENKLLILTVWTNP